MRSRLLPIGLGALLAVGCPPARPAPALDGSGSLRIEVSLGWGADEAVEREFEAAILSALGVRADADRILAAFDRTVRAWSEADRIPTIEGRGEIDWYESGRDLFDGNLLHVDFELEESDGYLTQLLEIERPGRRSVRGRAFPAGGSEPVFESRELPVPSFSGVEIVVGGLFDHFQRIDTVRLFLPGPDGDERAVYRCFPTDDPEWTVFSFQIPQPIAAQEKALDALLEGAEVDDHWIFGDPGDDLLALHHQIGIVRADHSAFERVERLLEVLRKAGEAEVLAAIESIRFPDGPVLEVREEEYRAPVLRVSLQHGPLSIWYLEPRTLETLYTSGPIDRRQLERALRADDFNFGTWLPDLWRGEEENLFVEIFGIRRAAALARGATVADRALFDATVRDLAAIGAYFDQTAVQINASPYVVHLTDEEISRVLAELRAAGREGQEAVPFDRSSITGRDLRWDVDRIEEKGMRFLVDEPFHYYEIRAQDVGRGLAGVLANLRRSFPGRYDHDIRFSGFRDEHLQEGMLLVLPRPARERVLGTARLKELVLEACEAEGYDWPELVYAIVWNESRAGRDNFFRFEPGRLRAIAKLRKGLRGEARKRFDAIQGRFGYLLAGSYGPGHVLYENAWALGFRGTPGEFARPETNLRYVVRFLKRHDLVRGTSLARVSRVYNGPAYKRNRYHHKLEQNLAKADRVF